MTKCSVVRSLFFHPYIVGVLISISGAIILFYMLIIANDNSSGDFRSHIQFAKIMGSDRGAIPPHPLFSIILSLCSGLSDRLLVWNWAAVVVLSFFVAAKFLATTAFLSENRVGRIDLRMHRAIAFWSLVLMLQFPVPLPLLESLGGEWIYSYWYRHSFPPSVWHNSTMIVLMPFAILTLIYGLRSLSDSSTKNVLLFCVCCFFSLLAKPSFFLVFAPVFFLEVFFSRLTFKGKMLNLGVLFFCGTFLLMQVVFLFVGFGGNEVRGGVSIGFLEVWQSDAQRTILGFVVALFLSLAFPIVFYICFPNCLRSSLHRVCAGMIFLSFVLAAFFVESAGGPTAGNMMWSTTSSLYLINLACASSLFMERDQSTALRHKIRICKCLLGLQAAIGLAYIVRYALLGTYD